IAIVKPWSKEMYDHNEALAEVVKNEVARMWEEACKQAEAEFVDEDDLGNEFIDMQWDGASEDMIKIQQAITYYSYSNQSIGDVAEEVEDQLENMPLYQLKELVEELEIKLEKDFIGFNN
uniref:hypothetical protein n=1 Tax=Candidatus Planktophila sp. TaxID=2175601 RepID=UPI004048F529